MIGFIFLINLDNEIYFNELPIKIIYEIMDIPKCKYLK
jgi:hypothetical protein